MKIQELLCYVILSGLFILFVDRANEDEPKISVLHEAENVAVPEDFRKAIGYDSLEIIFWKGKWQANFCYPNEWVLNRFKLDTIKTEK